MNMPSKFDPSHISISIVSHGHGKLVKDVLTDLQALMGRGAQVILTLNIAEDESFLNNLQHKPKLIRNSHPKGFGENHNNAFAITHRSWFVVINPDVRLDQQLFEVLLKNSPNENLGVIAPMVVGLDGKVQDSARLYPTFTRLFVRYLYRLIGSNDCPDYCVANNDRIYVNWLSGCFMIFNSKAFMVVGGFDTRYFMYLEDADICRRLNFLDYSVCLCPVVKVIHIARHASHSNWRHFFWHVKSMIRFLFNR